MCARSLGAAALVLLVPAILLAHAKLVRSSPSAGEHITVSPSSLRLVFSETPMAAVSRIVLLNSRGDTICLETARADPADAHALIADLRSTLVAGKYVVHWTAVPGDGHPARGSFSFTMAGAEGAPPTGEMIVPAAPAMPTESVDLAHAGNSTRESADETATSYPMIISRWIGFLALFSVIGAAGFKHGVLRRLTPATEPGDAFEYIASVGAATYGMFAAVVLLVTTIIKLYAESVAMRDASLGTILFATGWGWAWLVQTAACLLAIIGFRIAHRGGGAGWSLVLISALALGVTPAFTGHAIGSDHAVFGVPLDIVHVLAGGLWLGTLAVIVFVGIGAAAKTPGTISIGRRVASLINTFSPLALICGASVVATGVVASKFHLEPLSRLWTSTYGKTLIVKLIFVVFLFLLGAWNWRRMKPVLGGDEAVVGLQRSARLELTAAVMVLAVTAVLVALALPD